jgi:tRNA pseudouridine13 synthase
VGTEMRWPEGAPAELERQICSQILGENFDLARTRRLGEGTRRALRVWVQDLRWEIDGEDPGHGPACIRVYFVLPKGAYATTVLGAVFALDAGDGNEGQAEDS